ncbi:MAG: polyprenyl synthetase family protein [Deltaproteobacteria bacterium]|nr:polyprenyl synthetase family protein [Deltaproteobacteria bacterium]
MKAARGKITSARPETDNKVSGEKMGTDTEIKHRYKNHLKEINRALDKALSSNVPLIQDIGNYSLLGYGKRLRPLLFVLSCRLFDYNGDDTYRLSTIFEYIHTASLLHDDVLDNAEIRRNRPAANNIWGIHPAILEGDFLYSKASLIAVESNSIPFLKRVTETSTRMVEGQVLELIHTRDWKIGREDYLEIIKAKTAVLISAACACGAIISGGEESEEYSLAEFGMNLGIAFQLMDDLLDYTSSEEVFGKPVGKDLKEGKITLPLIYTVSGLEKSENKRIREVFSNESPSDEDCSDLVKLVRNSGAIDRIRNEAQSYIDEAMKCISRFPDSPVRTDLLRLGQYIIDREY